MSKQPPNRVLWTLVVDEIKLRQSYEFNKSIYKVDGFVDYGGIVKEGAGQLADHALLFMFVPMSEGWVQPIASFATKGAAPGRVLAELVLETVGQLHKYGATVIAVAGEHRINFSHYKVLFETEKTTHLKIVPKLTAAHVQPSYLQKMNVRLATQLFSRSIAIGLKIHREAGVVELQDCSGTEAFTKIMNDLFDALNAKHPQEGIRRGSPRIQASDIHF
ncbi:hypothetical protein HPB49_004133 [Dermacentor silvarum]|uniref:Uncharacterized protein n=1 Tax=Dermacentor silvarum TaxID=543639 RepID=A0ACB8DV70_DERSI|nr:hypothetical protein HPB49_004133 [Dermacentor silvarum]